MKILVTGAGGIVGQTLVAHLISRGYHVIAQVRRSEDIVIDHPLLIYRMGDVRDAAFLEATAAGADYVVHLASLKSDEKNSHEVNVGGMRNLICACQTQKVRGMIQMSTLSTKLAIKGDYASTKDEADHLLEESNVPHIILKPSVIYDDTERGIMGMLIRYTRLPFAPVIGSGRVQYYPIHAEDVAIAVEKILSKGWERAITYDLGGPEAISFNDLAQLVARDIHGRYTHLLHIPIPVALAIARMLKAVSKRPPITMSNVLGAEQDVLVDTSEFFATYDFHPRPIAEGIARIKAENLRQQSEPCVLFRYLAGRPANQQETEFYIQACVRYNLTDCPIDSFVLSSMRRIGALDAATKLLRPHGTFQRKMLIVAALYECSPASSARLLPREVSVFYFFSRGCMLGLRTVAKVMYGLSLMRYA